MEVIIASLISFSSTLLGGFFAIRFKNKLHLIMGFTAGVLLGVVAFNLLPEIMTEVFEQGIPIIYPMIALVAGFLFFHIIEKIFIIHHAHEGKYVQHKHPQVGILSALALASHSFLDGVGLGIGFQVNLAVGVLIGVAVVSHAFTDGMNTVALMLSHNNTDKRSKIFLLIDALAPVLGAASTLFFTVPPKFLTLYLGFFAGFLLYIGASDILPEAHSERSSLKIVGLTVLGTVIIFAVTRLA